MHWRKGWCGWRGWEFYTNRVGTRVIKREAIQRRTLWEWKEVLFITLRQQAKPGLLSKEVIWSGLFCSLAPCHLVCFAVSSWALKITFIYWIVNPSKDLQKVLPLLSGKCTSSKPDKIAFMMSRGLWAVWPPFLGSEIKDLLNLDASLMIFKTSLLPHSVAFHFPCAFFPCLC